MVLMLYDAERARLPCVKHHFCSARRMACTRVPEIFPLTRGGMVKAVAASLPTAVTSFLYPIFSTVK